MEAIAEGLRLERADHAAIICLLALLITLSVGSSGNTAAPVVSTTTGPVRGTTLKVLDWELNAYLGIPYAMPPVNELRFRRPAPVISWTEVYNATSLPPPCYQFLPAKRYYLPDPENMTEDCLYLNVWAPKRPNSTPKLRPVMVFLHGGAFLTGSSDMIFHDGSTLAAYGDVIVASMNFRVGILGYLFADSEGARGNMALYDQLLAMRWIKENAEAFGGDTTKITLFGESSGAMSAAVHLISPLSKDLFNRAILQSGGALHPLVLDSRAYQKEVANTIATHVGCTGSAFNLTTNPTRVLSCMRSKPVEDIIAALGARLDSEPFAVTPVYGDELLPLEPSEYLRKHPRDKEILIGITEDEGSFFMVEGGQQYFGTDGYNGTENFSKSLANTILRAAFRMLRQDNGREIADYYTRKNPMKRKDMRKAMYDAIGDFLITCNTVLYADLYSKNKDNTRFFMFKHRISRAFTAEWMGVTHSQDLPIVFGMPLHKKYNFTKEEEAFSRRMMDRWLQFAKTGNPDTKGQLKWPYYRYEYPVYLGLDLDETIRLRPDYGRCEFWRKAFRAEMNYQPIVEGDQKKIFKISAATHAEQSVWASLLLTFVSVQIYRQMFQP